MIHHVALKPAAKMMSGIKKPTDPSEALTPTSRSPMPHPLQDSGSFEDTRATMGVQDDEAPSPAIASEAVSAKKLEDTLASARPSPYTKLSAATTLIPYLSKSLPETTENAEYMNVKTEYTKPASVLLNPISSIILGTRTP